MRSKKISSEFQCNLRAGTGIQQVRVVGTVHSRACLKRALKLAPGEVDFVEIRVDCFAGEPALLALLDRSMPELALPMVITARHPAEGGANALGAKARRDLLLRYLPFASVIDVELRSAAGMKTVLDKARSHDVQILLSNHHFKATPPKKTLCALMEQATQAGADIFKVATWMSQPSDIAAVLELMEAPRRVAVSAMGMGPFGKVSRLLLARAGSTLNYGYLGKPNASGQWEAPLLRQRIGEVLAD